MFYKGKNSFTIAIPTSKVVFYVKVNSLRLAIIQSRQSVSFTCLIYKEQMKVTRIEQVCNSVCAGVSVFSDWLFYPTFSSI